LAELMQLDTLYWPVVQVEQLVQFKLVVMPRMVEYVPAMQEMHWLDEVIPVPLLYFPAGQASQFTPLQFAGGWS
jgi:hypothetical protein